MTIIIRTIGGKTEVDCTEEEGKTIMTTLDGWESGNLRITLSNGQKDIIINHRHFVEAFAVYGSTAKPE